MLIYATIHITWILRHMLTCLYTYRNDQYCRNCKEKYRYEYAEDGESECDGKRLGVRLGAGRDHPPSRLCECKECGADFLPPRQQVCNDSSEGGCAAAKHPNDMPSSSSVLPASDSNPIYGPLKRIGMGCRGWYKAGISGAQWMGFLPAIFDAAWKLV
jgi:hypothetical protein